jgi:hypothetical protein
LQRRRAAHQAIELVDAHGRQVTGRAVTSIAARVRLSRRSAATNSATVPPSASASTSCELWKAGCTTSSMLASTRSTFQAGRVSPSGATTA